MKNSPFKNSIKFDLKASVFQLTVMLALTLAFNTVGAAVTCTEVFQAKTQSTVRAGTKKSWAKEDFRKIADVVEKNQSTFIEILQAVDNHHGAKYEVEQVIKTLRGVEYHEFGYLTRVEGVNNVAVYGSTNIPLYTLIMHGILPASVAQNVWLRTPQASREVYSKLHSKLQELLGDRSLDGLHILTEAKDVQYDNFRKMHVLGMNRKGSRFERDPSEVIIFTGSPETGDRIVGEIKKKLEESAPDRNFKQLFLMFGSGLNPVIVTEYAKGKTEPAIRAAVEAIRINSSQDCIAPKLYAIEKSVEEEYFRQLLPAIKALRFGSAKDPGADYSALTFAESLDSLVAFRTKYQAYLKNPEAVLNPTSRQVDPHVFLFPYEMLKQIELEDHFAPFLVHFRYEGRQQLEEIANDPRIRNRAMFASLFGDPANTEMFQLRKLFEDNFHSTTVNLSIFQEESGNFPFGGYGGRASAAHLITKSKGTGSESVTMKSFFRPILFSKEAATFFSSSNQSGKAMDELLENRVAQLSDSAGLTEALRIAVDANVRAAWTHHNWNQLQDPFLGSRPRGLTALRAAMTRGFKVLIQKSKPGSAYELERDRMFYGDSITYIGESYQSLNQAAFQKVPGVVLHPSFIGADIPVFNAVRGELNPHLGFGLLGPLLFGNRVTENKVANAIWPGIMPAHKSFKELMQGQAGAAGFQSLRSAALQKLNQHLISQKKPNEAELAEIRGHLTSIIDLMMATAQKQFPKGTFLKNYGESTTGDLGTQITSFNYNSNNMINQFLNAYLTAFASGRDYESDYVQKRITRNYYETGTKFINQVLRNPDMILVQERVMIEKTDLGFPLEVRVDYVDGEPVMARPRYTHEYLGKDLEAASQVVQKFFEKAPEQMKYLSGGADVVKLQDGSWRIIELNAGANSGTISPVIFPIWSNQFLSNLTGRKMPLIQMLESTYAKGSREMNSYLKSLKVEKEPWNKHSIDDLSVGEVSRWVRDQALAEFDRAPTQANADRLRAFLTEAFDGVGSSMNRDLPLLMRGFDNYTGKQLSVKSQRDPAAESSLTDADKKKQVVEAEIEELRKEAQKLFDQTKSEEETERIKDKYRGLIYEKMFTLIEFFQVSPLAGPSEALKSLAASDDGTAKDLREITSMTLCPQGQFEKCQTLAAYGEPGAIPREVSEPMGYNILKQIQQKNEKMIFVDAHSHPFASTSRLYEKGNAAKNPVIKMTEPKSFLSGPSTYDCLDYHGRYTNKYPNLVAVSAVIDPGGIWFCRSNWSSELDSKKGFALLKIRAELVRASQQKKGSELKLAIDRYRSEYERIFKSQKLKIRFLPHGASNEEIEKTVIGLK